MTKPLSLFIRPPYEETVGGTVLKTTTRLNYGDKSPGSLSQWGATSEFLLLQTSQPEKPIYAAATGYLSIRNPEDVEDNPQDELLADTNPVVPERIGVYLQPDPVPEQNYHARVNGLPQDEPVLYPGNPNPLQFFSNPVGAFYYINLSTASLKTAVSTHLANKPFPGWTNPDTKEEQLWKHFLAGNLKIRVMSGDEIGRAGLPIVPPGDDSVQQYDDNVRQIGFTVFSRSGTHDPAHFYDFMQEFVVEETDINAFLAIAPKQWPLIPRGISKQEAINRTAEKIYPFTTLDQVRDRFVRENDWTRADWRSIGDNQKAIYRRRLLQRVGEADNSDDPPFMFNDFDWKNIFQLEAIVEFYINFPEPWDANATPVNPTDPDFRQIDFLPLSGNGATVQTISNRTFVNLNEPANARSDLSRILPDKDLIWLAADTAHDNQLYRIKGIDEPQNRLLIEGTPTVNGNTAWTIRHRPTLVIVDSFGHRIAGTHATIGNTTNNQTTITLNSSANTPAILGQSNRRGRVNKHKFETIFFPNDTNDNAHEPRTYRIVDVTNANTIVVEGQPTFTGGNSSWQIPAGLGTALPELFYNLSGSATRGWDHYNGMLFIVHQGVIQSDFPTLFPAMINPQTARELQNTRFRWTSYTSHNYEANHPQLSSVRGNQEYFYSSYRSNRPYINYTFKVVDKGAALKGTRASIVQNTTPIRIQLDGEPNLNTIRTENNRDKLVLHTDQNTTAQNTRMSYDISAVNTDAHSVTIDGIPSLSTTTTSWIITDHNGNPDKGVPGIYDGVRQARYYFSETVVGDNADETEEPTAANLRGKTVIRLHYGDRASQSTGSAGCLVSRVYFEMRNFLIHLYLHELEMLTNNQNPDTHLQSIKDDLGNSLSSNQAGYQNVSAENWNKKLAGTLWLIRPDERPLG